MEHFRGSKYSPVPERFKVATWRMRHDPTLAEKILWEELRLNRLNGFRFRQQHVIGSYIADFYCHQAKLVVEVDGSSHDFRKAEDAVRDRYMHGLGLTVLRFRNDEVLHAIEKVKTEIRSAFNQTPKRR